jgi:hypothetical protein
MNGRRAICQIPREAGSGVAIIRTLCYEPGKTRMSELFGPVAQPDRAAVS